MFFKSLATVVCVAACSVGVSSASAGDLYGGSVKDAPPISKSWSGAYVGVHAGYGWGDVDVDLSNSTGAIFYNDPFVPDQGSLSSSAGGIGGFQVGYNVQSGTLVVGLEADFSWTGMNADGRFTTPLGSQWDIESDINYFGTVRGRLGALVTNNLLLYATGGLAWANVDVKQATNFIAPPDVGGRTSGDFNHIGYAIGAGAEVALGSNWTLKGEYLFVDLGKEDYQLKGTTKPNGSVPYVETFASDIELQVLRAGLNYKF